MTCASCVARVEGAIARKPGVESATVEFLPATVSRARIAQANVGVAIGTGTVIAVEAGEVILMHGDLICAADAAALARRTLRIIRLNFVWAYAYNVPLIPLAAGAFYPTTGWLLNPMLAAGAMSISTRFLVINSLRLRRFRPPRPHVSPPEPRDAGQSKSNSPIRDSSHVRVFH